MTDPTGTSAGHPALLTATGPSTPPSASEDATGTAAGHPAIVTRLPYVPPKPKAKRKARPKPKRRPNGQSPAAHFTG